MQMAAATLPKIGVGTLARGLPLVWVALVTLALGWCMRRWGYDDPYITYRYAENLAHGLGFVYNDGERVLSTTTPLYTLLLALARLVGLDVPLTSLAIGCLSLALGGLALWHGGQAWDSPAAGAVGLLLYPLFPLLLPTLGAETALYIALILWGLLAYGGARYTIAAALLALAALTRADGLLAAGVAGAHFVLVRRTAIPWRAVVVYIVPLVAWFGFAWAYFGAPLPVTLLAKQQQGRLAISAGHSFLDGLVQRLRGYWAAPLYRVQLVLACVGLVYAIGWARRWLPLVGWALLYVVAYIALGVTGYFWYYGPVAAGLVMLVGLGVAAVAALVRWRGGARAGTGVAVALTLLVLWPTVTNLLNLNGTTDQRMNVYRAAGLWLRDHAPPAASVGTPEVGVIGYYAERRMIDFAGLIQPETARQFTPQTTYEDAAVAAMRRYQPGYLVASQGFFDGMAARDATLNVRCRRVETLDDPRFSARPLVIYACS